MNQSRGFSARDGTLVTELEEPQQLSGRKFFNQLTKLFTQIIKSSNTVPTSHCVRSQWENFMECSTSTMERFDQTILDVVPFKHRLPVAQHSVAMFGICNPPRYGCI